MKVPSTVFWLGEIRSGQIGSDRVRSGQIGSDRVGSGQIGSDRVGSPMLFSVTITKSFLLCRRVIGYGGTYRSRPYPEGRLGRKRERSEEQKKKSRENEKSGIGKEK
jgi:hypothetical protein